MKQPGSPSASRRRVLITGMLLTGIILLGRSFQLQVMEGGTWRTRATEQHGELDTLPAPRGTIYDRHHTPLAASRETYRIAVAPKEITDRGVAQQVLTRALGLSASEARRATDARRRWVVLPGRFDASARGALQNMHGFYFERVMERFYPHGALALELLGNVSVEGRPLAGLELQLDSILSGKPGVAVARRDAHGKPIPGAMMTAVEAVPGRDVVLTIDAELQEIAQEALRRSVEETQAAGGELLLTDPRTGEVLAAASARGRSAYQWLAATEPYEPGSTAKPFFVAALLSEGAATLADSVFAENGRLVKDGRTVQDVHEFGWLSVRDALRFSSNVAMVKLSDRLDPAVQYRYLRDFGFGTPTGVPYPSEASGVLRRPRQWSRYSQGSLAIGYELSVTPLQMAMAYGAIANDGVLLEPRLVREVRTRDGRAVSKFSPRAVRRVIPPEIARQLRETLRGVVEGGTGSKAALGPYNVAGKTGTARMYHAGRYEAGSYAASFAGFFPADDPKLVFLAKLDRPKGVYYGGMAAAPITRAALEAALASRTTALDRSVVAQPAPRAVPARVVRASVKPPIAETGPFIFAMSGGAPRPFVPSDPRPDTVPDVVGLTVRDAAARLHAAGFQVRVSGTGVVRSTRPEIGSAQAQHAIVELLAEDLR